MDFLLAYVMAGLGTVVSLFWAFLYFRYNRKFQDVLTAVDEKEFLLPELFFIGFGVIELFHINMQSPYMNKRMRTISEVRGEKYAAFYTYITFGAQITYAFTIAPLGLFVGAISNDPIIGLLGIGAAFTLVLYLDAEVKNAINRRRDDIMRDLPQMISKLALLVCAGLVMRDAWKQVAYTGNGTMYLEMQTACEDFENGISEVQAIEHFAQRCSVKEVKKFSSIIVQNIQKGSSELAVALKQLASESWEQKKRTVKIKGELASQKLMIPTGIMFLGILLMIIVPAFSSIVI